MRDTEKNRFETKRLGNNIAKFIDYNFLFGKNVFKYLFKMTAIPLISMERQ